MWELQPLTTRGASTVCNRDNFTFSVKESGSLFFVRDYCEPISSVDILRAKGWTAEESGFVIFFPVCYLTALSVLTLCSDSDRLINEYGVGSGMRIGRGIEVLVENLP
jgi:hypothetical protein